MQDACCYYISAYSTCSSEVGLLADVHVWDVLVLAEEWQVQNDFEWLGIGGQNDQIGNTSVQAFCGLVGTLLQLLVEHGLVAQIKNLLL